MIHKKIDENSIDVNAWDNILSNIKGKKIVVFGAGNNGKVLADLLPYKISYFVDNDSKKWSGNISGISINNPEVLKTEKESVAVLVVGYLYKDMINQLEKYELEKNIQIFNVYNILKFVLNEISFSNRGDEIKIFLEKISMNIKIKNKSVHKEKISLIISNFAYSSSPFYLIAIAVMLKVRGNDVQIVWDDVEGIDEIYYDCKNATNMQNVVIHDVLKYVHNRFNIEIIRISEMDAADLDNKDIESLKRFSKVNTISKYRVIFFDIEAENYERKCFEVLKSHMKKIKYFFENYSIDKLISFTGIHKKTGLYTLMANKNEIPMFSYDTADSGLMITTEGIVTHQMDIKKIIKEKKINNDLSSKIISWAKEHFSKRMKSINNKSNGVYQKTNYIECSNEYNYDIVIPLNICWDGAALGINSYFNSVGDWLIETIGYVLENTTATIAVRQHPAERIFESGKDIKLELKKNFANNPRFAYISCEDSVNTYNLIEGAKLVLPYTSTIGVESALLNKSVILENGCYYSEMGFVQKAKSKDDYFNKIKYSLNNKVEKISKEQMDEAFICYGLLMFNHIKTSFTDSTTDLWIREPFENLLIEKSVETVISIFETGKTLALTQIEEYFN